MNARFQYYKLSNIYEDESYLKMVGENKPKYLYRYMEYSELSLKTLFDEKIWLSLPLYLNDPFEYEYGVYANGVLIGCFSEKYDSLVMWSQSRILFKIQL